MPQGDVIHKHLLYHVRMDIYADKVSMYTKNGSVHFTACNGDDSYTWKVPLMELFGLDTTSCINIVVDAFRRKFGKLGL